MPPTYIEEILATLSSEECQVLYFFCKGMPIGEYLEEWETVEGMEASIANALEMPRYTVRDRFKSIYEKFGIGGSEFSRGTKRYILSNEVCEVITEYVTDIGVDCQNPEEFWNAVIKQKEKEDKPLTAFAPLVPRRREPIQKESYEPPTIRGEVVDGSITQIRPPEPPPTEPTLIDRIRGLLPWIITFIAVAILFYVAVIDEEPPLPTPTAQVFVVTATPAAGQAGAPTVTSTSPSPTITPDFTRIALISGTQTAAAAPTSTGTPTPTPTITSTPSPEPLFEDTFDDGVDPQWERVSGEWTRVEGELTTLTQPGNWSTILVGDNNWKNYVITADYNMTLSWTRLRIIVRAQDSDNYMTFNGCKNLSSECTTAWYIRNDGEERLLAKRSDDGRTIDTRGNFRVIVENNSYTIYVNGKNISSFDYQAFSSGRVGLAIYCWKQQCAYIDNFKVSSLQ